MVGCHFSETLLGSRVQPLPQNRSTAYPSSPHQELMNPTDKLDIRVPDTMSLVEYFRSLPAAPGNDEYQGRLASIVDRLTVR